MNIDFVKGAEKELKELEKEQLNFIKEKIEELKDDPTDHEDTKLIQIKGRDIYRLEIKEERMGKIDHRAIYDIENDKIRIYSIFYREPGYPEEEIANRF
jgi:mRNA-degrading endonuclease RelE of RelBE toxin-antitoxin system